MKLRKGHYLWVIAFAFLFCANVIVAGRPYPFTALAIIILLSTTIVIPGVYTIVKIIERW